MECNYVWDQDANVKGKHLSNLFGQPTGSHRKVRRLLRRQTGWKDGSVDGWSDGRAADTCRRCFSRGETNVAEDAVRHSVAVAVPKTDETRRKQQQGKSARGFARRARMAV